MVERMVLRYTTDKASRGRPGAVEVRNFYDRLLAQLAAGEHASTGRIQEVRNRLGWIPAPGSEPRAAESAMGHLRILVRRDFRLLLEDRDVVRIHPGDAQTVRNSAAGMTAYARRLKYRIARQPLPPVGHGADRVASDRADRTWDELGDHERRALQNQGDLRSVQFRDFWNDEFGPQWEHGATATILI
jgi:hypothetical protein